MIYELIEFYLHTVFNTVCSKDISGHLFVRDVSNRKQKKTKAFDKLFQKYR